VSASLALLKTELPNSVPKCRNLTHFLFLTPVTRLMEYPDFIIVSPEKKTPLKPKKMTKESKIFTIESDSEPKTPQGILQKIQNRGPTSGALTDNLKCPVCLDDLKDPTSTTCGHLFCWRCIQISVSDFKHCPTCRKKLTRKAIHRIFI
jgi:hypothetical protein